MLLGRIYLFRSNVLVNLMSVWWQWWSQSAGASHSLERIRMLLSSSPVLLEWGWKRSLSCLQMRNRYRCEETWPQPFSKWKVLLKMGLISHASYYPGQDHEDHQDTQKRHLVFPRCASFGAYKCVSFASHAYSKLVSDIARTWFAWVPVASGQVESETWRWLRRIRQSLLFSFVGQACVGHTSSLQSCFSTQWWPLAAATGEGDATEGPWWECLEVDCMTCSHKKTLINTLQSHSHVCVCLLASVTSDSLWPHGLQPASLLCLWDFPGENTGVGCHALLQGIFPNQGSNPRLLKLLHCRWILCWAIWETIHICVCVCVCVCVCI